MKYPCIGACFTLKTGYEVPLQWGLFQPYSRIGGMYSYIGACFTLRAGYEVPLQWGLFHPESRINIMHMFSLKMSDNSVCSLHAFLNHKDVRQLNVFTCSL